MEIRVRTNSSIYIIDINGEIDLYNCQKLKDLIMNMMAKNIKNYIINLDKVVYIDSSGIGALISTFTKLKRENKNLRITNLHGSVKKVIELTKLIGFLPITETLEEAVSQLKAKEK